MGEMYRFRGVEDIYSQGAGTGFVDFCLGAKHLASIRKILCDWTQKVLGFTQNQSQKKG